MKINKIFQIFGIAICGGIIFSTFVSAQGKRKATASSTAAVSAAGKSNVVNAGNARVKQLDADGLKKVITPNGKPLLVNFWATWCDPCREEFPDLVKINADYKDKIDFAAVSLDDLAEINREVPAFLTEMKAEMPAYLLKVPDEDAVISTVSKDWQGGLPFSILYDANGTAVYTKMGKIEPQILRQTIDKMLAETPSS